MAVQRVSLNLDTDGTPYFTPQSRSRFILPVALVLAGIVVGFVANVVSIYA